MWVRSGFSVAVTTPLTDAASKAAFASFKSALRCHRNSSSTDVMRSSSVTGIDSSVAINHDQADMLVRVLEESGETLSEIVG